jgi:integrase
MAFEIRPSVWDDSEPDYAPGLKLRKARGTFFWRPSKKYLDAGYSIKTYTLHGRQGDGLDLERAAHCRALTREMLEWYEGKTQGRTPGTWGYIVGRYKADQFSKYHRVSPATRESYNEWLARFEMAIGEVRIEHTNVETMYGWIERMQDKGRSTAFIHKFFAHFGLLVTHGILISEPGCAEVKAIRSAMRLEKGAPRTAFVTRDQVQAIIQEADRRGWAALALSVLFRFEYMLRGVDVYGQWVLDDGTSGGIRHHGRVWTTGLTWDMFDPDLRGFDKVINKTKRKLPEAYHFDLIPSIRERLAQVPEEQRVGPVIVSDDGLPPRRYQMAKQFKIIVRSLGLPDHLQIRDLRPGGGTEARDLATPMELRDAMGHTQITTTDLYVRNRSTHANKIVALRQQKAGGAT